MLVLCMPLSRSCLIPHSSRRNRRILGDKSGRTAHDRRLAGLDGEILFHGGPVDNQDPTANNGIDEQSRREF